LESLNKLNLSVIDLYYNGYKYYPNLYKYYSFNNYFNEEKIKLFLNNKFYDLYKNNIYKYFEYKEKLDVIILINFNYNIRLATYFNSLIDYLKHTSFKPKFLNNPNIIENFEIMACLLRNDVKDKKQKSILGFKYGNRQYIIDDTLDNIIVPFIWFYNQKLINFDYQIKDSNGTEYNYNFDKGDNIFIMVNKSLIQEKIITDNSVNYWYKTIEIFLFIFKNNDFDIDLFSREQLKILNIYNDNYSLENLIKKNRDNSHIIFKKLRDYNEYKNDLPFFELYLIDLLKNRNLKVIDIFKLNDKEYYSNIYKYYTFDKEFDSKNINELLNEDTNSLNVEKPDIIIFTDYNQNKQLGNYFKNLNDYLSDKSYKLRLLNEKEREYLNKYNLIACLLRNNKNDTHQKTLLCIISKNNHYIIDDNKLVQFDWMTEGKFTDKDYKIIDENDYEYNYNFANGDKIFIFINDKCKNFDVIPQFSGTCWFNAILMASLYSQGSRNILLNKIKDNKWGNKDSLQKVLKSILIQSYKPDKTKIRDLYKKIKPENILLKLISKHDNDFKEKFKKIIQKKSNLGYNTKYIVKYLKHIGMKCLDIFYQKTLNEYFVNYYNFFENENFNNELNKQELKDLLSDRGPDYLILFHSELFNDFNDYYYYDWIHKTPNKKDFKIDGIINKSNLKQIQNYEDIIDFNGNKYKLDSCILVNYNMKDKGGHAIVGLRCNNKKYVYNGWNQKNTSSSPCSLMPYEWDLKNKQKFCLNQKECKLDNINKDDLCFSFNKGYRILVYTKIIEEKEIDLNISESSKSNSLSHMSSIISDVYDLKDYSETEIINYLIENHGYKKEDLEDKDLNELKLDKEIGKHYNLKKAICTNIDVIPQFKNTNTKWFNAILMASLYSQGSRNILLNKIKDNKWGNSNEDSLQKVLKSILIQSYKPDKTKIRDLYKKIKPEHILLKMISKYDNNLKELFKKQLLKLNNFIVKYLKFIGMKCLDIYYNEKDDTCFVNFFNYIRNYSSTDYIKNTNFNRDDNNTEFDNLLKDDEPDYLILFHNQLFKDFDKYYFWFNISDNKNDFIKDDLINDSIKNNIRNYENIIHFNGNEYKLDSCLLDNYNDYEINKGHTIVGLTCNNKRYVYNDLNHEGNTDVTPCSLIPYNWDLKNNEEFCLNQTKCKLNFEKEDDLCFSFNKGNRILIYTKIIKIKKDLLNISESSKSHNLSHMESIINDMYNLDNYTENELRQYLLNHYSNRYTDEKIKSFNKNQLKSRIRRHSRKRI